MEFLDALKVSSQYNTTGCRKRKHESIFSWTFYPIKSKLCMLVACMDKIARTMLLVNSLCIKARLLAGDRFQCAADHRQTWSILAFCSDTDDDRLVKACMIITSTKRYTSIPVLITKTHVSDHRTVWIFFLLFSSLECKSTARLLVLFA